MLKYAYLGSCRYEHVFEHAFPPRLHSIREINNFFQKINSLSTYLSESVSEDEIMKVYANLVFGDAFNPYIRKKTIEFVPKLENFLKSQFLFIEISSLEYAISRCGQIFNKYLLLNETRNISDKYFNFEIFRDGFLKFEKDNIESFQKQLLKLKEYTRKFMNLKKIYLIPHSNLKLRSFDEKILKRIEIEEYLKQSLSLDSVFEIIDIWNDSEIKKNYLDDIFNEHPISKKLLNFNDKGNNLVKEYFFKEFGLSQSHIPQKRIVCNQVVSDKV